MQKDIILALSLAQKKFYKYNTTIIYFNHSFFFLVQFLDIAAGKVCSIF